MDYFLEHVPHVPAIWVRGSVARGEPGPYSDIDMILVLDRERVLPGDRYYLRRVFRYEKWNS